jgi:putative transposase
VFLEYRGFYGSPRIHQELRASGRHVCRHRVARLMRRAELRARTRKAFRPCSKAGAGAVGVVENLLQQDFRPLAPNRCWAGVITYIRSTSGWRYLAVWIDLFSRRVVGWTLDQRMDAALVIEAFSRALGHRQVAPDQLLIHRSGQPVPGKRLPGAAPAGEDHLQHVRQGLLLGQRGGGELFLHPETGTKPR